MCVLNYTYIGAQVNLVYNGDFELYDTCPTGLSTPTDYQINHCLGWTAPTMGTSDYYNACFPTPGGVDVPLNTVGYQNAQSGNAYLGLLAFWLPYPWVEYVQGKTTATLLQNKKYRFSFYYSLADQSSHTIKNIGILISQNAPSSTNTYPLNISPTLLTDVNYPADTMNWYYFEQEFTAREVSNLLPLVIFTIPYLLIH